MNLSFVPIIPVSTSSLDLLHVYSLSQYPTKSLFAPKIKKMCFTKIRNGQMSTGIIGLSIYAFTQKLLAS